MHLEVCFPAGTTVTVSLASSVADSAEAQFCETCLFALFAARQISELGRGDFIGSSLATTLLGIDEAAPLADIEAKLGDVRVRSAAAHPAHQGFTAQFCPNKRAFFELRAYGFGLVTGGAGDYASISTLAVLAYLLRKRAKTPEYQAALAAAARNIGIAGGVGAMGVASYQQIAWRCAGAAWNQVTETGNGDMAASSNLRAEPVSTTERFGIDLGEILSKVQQRVMQLVEETAKGQMRTTS
jgi:hypothetical protein